MEMLGQLEPPISYLPSKDLEQVDMYQLLHSAKLCHPFQPPMEMLGLLEPPILYPQFKDLEQADMYQLQH